ncbi:MAG: prolipoprotein diacylglyceryl transferase family protein [Chloroflexota bacterium]
MRSPAHSAPPVATAVANPPGWNSSATSAVAPTDSNHPKQAGGALETFLERNAPQVVAVTYWFDPPPQPPIQSLTIQFVGRRLDATAPPQPGDEFVHEEPLPNVVAGSGPISVTAKVRDVNPGEWEVKARMLPRNDGEIAWAGRSLQPRRPPPPVYPARWSWRRWRLSAGPTEPATTCLAPLAHSPAVLLGSWAVFVPLGVVIALVTQALVMSAAHLQLSYVLTVSLLTVLIGAIGAKAWYMVLHRRQRGWEGWGVGGFLTGIAIALPLLLGLLRVPIGPFLDASAPGLMFGLAVGRLGCFFTGCCAGRPTASRWGVWSSNRSIGARRVPAQLLESASALIVGLPTLAAVLTSGPGHGTLFIAGFAAYTLIRQGILLLREERRQSRYGIALIAASAALTFAIDLVFLARR